MHVDTCILQGVKIMCEIVDAVNPTQLEISSISPLDPKSLDSYLDRVDHVHLDTEKIRDNLILQLATGVRSIDFSDINQSKPGDVEKKLMAVDALDRLLGNKEKASINQANLRLKNREVKGSEAIGQVVTDILAKIDLSINVRPTTTNYTIDPLQEQALTSLADNEIIPDTERRTDPYHLDEE